VSDYPYDFETVEYVKAIDTALDDTDAPTRAELAAEREAQRRCGRPPVRPETSRMVRAVMLDLEAERRAQAERDRAFYAQFGRR
jgi:hypothetical protein